MLIVSDHKDYYDSATMGVDKALVYHRDCDLVDENYDAGDSWRDPGKWPLPTDITRYLNQRNHNGAKYHQPFFLGFCGKIYVGAAINKELRWDYPAHPLSEPDEKFFKDDKYKPQITYDKEVLVEYFKPRFRSFLHPRENAFVDLVNRGPIEDDTIFLEHKVPCFLIYGGARWSTKKRLVLNPVLKMLEFPKVMDPFTAHQELAMYLGDRLRLRDKPMIETSDRDRAIAHGMDKTSFRRDGHPSKPRRKKKKKK